MAVSIERTGEKSFIAYNDNNNDPWYEAVADYSVEPPDITIKFRRILFTGETWQEVDQALTQLENG